MNSKTLIVLLLVLACTISVQAQTYNASVVSLFTFNETGTTTAIDYVGGYNLTLSNIGLRNSSAVNGSGSIGNVSSTWNMQFAASPNFSQIKSMSFWMKRYGQLYLMSNTTANGAEGYIDGLNRLVIAAPDLGSKSIAISATNTTAGQWIHVVVVANGASSAAYYNGSAQSITISGTPASLLGNGQNFMRYAPTNSLFWTGNLDNLCLYNTTLNSSQALEVYNTERANGNCLGVTVAPTGPSYNVTNTTMSSPLIALTPQSLQLNISYNGSINATNAAFFYNDVLYGYSSKTTTSGGISNDTYVINFSTLNVANGTIVGAYWAYNISFTNGTILEANTSNQSQTILNLLAGNCTANVTANRVLNYSIKNVETSAAVSANSIFNFTLSYDNGLSQNFLLNYTGNSNPAICVYPSWVVTNYTVTASLSATGYAPNTYIANGQVSNTTNNINIHMTNSSSGTAITYNVVDSSELPLSGMTVQSFQYDVGTGTLTQVDSLVTDDDGQGVAFLILNQYFVWKIYDTSNNLVLTHGPIYLPTTTTSQTFIIGGNITTGLTDWITVYGLSCTVTNSTVPLGTTTTWNSTNANISNYCFNLFNVSGGNMVLFNQSCSSNQSGTLFLPAYNETSWLAFPTMEVNGSDTTFILWCGGESPLSFSTYSQTQPVFGVEGVFWALILLVLLMTIGFAGQGAEYISMLLIIGWTALVSLFNLIPWGWSTFIGIAAFLIVWVMGMRRER